MAHFYQMSGTCQLLTAQQTLWVVVVAVWHARGWPRRGRKDHTTFSYLVYLV